MRQRMGRSAGSAAEEREDRDTERDGLTLSHHLIFLVQKGVRDDGEDEADDDTRKNLSEAEGLP